MPPHDLTPAEIADLLVPNHSEPLSGAELDRLTRHLTHAQMEEVIERLGLTDLARQLPPILIKVVQAAQRLAREHPPAYDDEVDTLIRNFDAVELGLREPSPSPPGSPEPPRESQRPSTPVSTPDGRSSPPPTTPSSSARSRYVVESPTKSGPAASWFEAGSLTQGVRGAGVHAVGGRARPRAPKAKAHAYVVFFGGEVGVFQVWSDVQRSITGHGLAIHSGYPSVATAEAALQYARQQGWTADSTTTPGTFTSSAAAPRDDNPLNTGTSGSWYAVCRGVVPGVYRSYLECCLNTAGVSGNLCNSFATRRDAELAFSQALRAGWVRAIPRASTVV